MHPIFMMVAASVMAQSPPVAQGLWQPLAIGLLLEIFRWWLERHKRDKALEKNLLWVVLLLIFFWVLTAP